MSREIRFRAFHMRDKVFWYFNLVTIRTSKSIDRDWFYLEPAQQFTGLIDRNSKEIYEGDILKTGTEKHMVVGWSERFASFVIHRQGWAFQHWFGEACSPEDVEVIGNIHETPDLLK